MLIDDLIEQGYLKTPRIISAFRKIKRADFMPENSRHRSEVNAPVEIGFGQTISQPLTVAFMLELLQPQEGDNILDVGSGSGWTTALLSEIAGDKGKVYGVEIVPELKEFGERNASKYNFVKKGITEFILGDGNWGLKKHAPYDRILVSASAEKVPTELERQLKIGGILVIPVKESIWKIVRKENGKFERKEYPGFVFVPLIRTYQGRETS
jgi:protein-L-isoaspartate(D-aspartate) O-methyltransferase